MLDPDALIHPTGRIHPDLFPERTSDDLVADVQGWIHEAYGKAEVVALSGAPKDSAAAAWAYYRAFDAASVAMAANPSSHAQTDAGSSSYAKDQRDAIRAMADRFRAEFQMLAHRPTIGLGWSGGATVHHDFTY